MENKPAIPLTSAEIGKLWAAYEGNTMVICLLRYFLKHVEDQDIKAILELALANSQKYVQTIKDLFTAEQFPIPRGFTDEDVNLDAPRLYLDPFYLHYLKYDVKAGISLYGIAVPLMARADVSQFFVACLKDTIDLCSKINEALLTKGLFVRAPYIPAPDKVEFVEKQNFFNGFFGHIRPLQALAMTHLYDNIQNSAVSKAKQTGFSQSAQSKQVREFFVRAREVAEKQIELFDSLLKADNLPGPLTYDDLVTDSTIPPFSDRLMLFHAIESAAIRVRGYGNSLSFNARHDVSVVYARLIAEMGHLAEDGGKLMIENGWLEKPPAAVDREDLARV